MSTAKPIIRRPEKGVYISLEGISGSGKTYILNKVRKYLRFSIIDELSDETGKFEIPKQILNLLESESDRFFYDKPPITTAMLVFSAQLYSIETKVIDGLRKDKVIIADRGIDSPALYQAILYHWDDYDEEKALASYKIITEAMRKIVFFPDKTLVLQDTFPTCISRAEGREKNKYSKLELKILERAYEGYKAIKDGDRIIHLQETEDPIQKLLSIIDKLKQK